MLLICLGLRLYDFLGMFIQPFYSRIHCKKTITRPPQIPPLQKKKIDVHDIKLPRSFLCIHLLMEELYKMCHVCFWRSASIYFPPTFLNCHFLTNTKRAVRKVDVPMVIHSELAAFRSPRSPLLQSARKKITKSLSCFLRHISNQNDFALKQEIGIEERKSGAKQRQVHYSPACR